jgi:hypothetical protein
MAALDTRTPRIFALEDALRRRPSPAAAPSPVEQLVRSMQIVKAARFNAAERLERKQLASQVALSVVSLYFVGLSVWQAVYAPDLSDRASRLITLVSIVSSVFTLVLALIEAMNDYKIKAHHMQTCALEVNDLLQELRLAEPRDTDAIQEFRRRYNAIVRGCPFNHARIDYLMTRPGRRWEYWVLTRLRYLAGVYGLYALCLAGPPLLLVAFR